MKTRVTTKRPLGQRRQGRGVRQGAVDTPEVSRPSHIGENTVEERGQLTTPRQGKIDFKTSDGMVHKGEENSLGLLRKQDHRKQPISYGPKTITTRGVIDGCPSKVRETTLLTALQSEEPTGCEYTGQDTTPKRDIATPISHDNAATNNTDTTSCEERSTSDECLLAFSTTVK